MLRRTLFAIIVSGIAAGSVGCLDLECASLDSSCNAIASALYAGPCVPAVISGSLQGCGALALSGQTTTIAGNGIPVVLDGIGTAAGISTPTSLAFTGSQLLVPELLDSVVRRFDPTSTGISTILGAAGMPGFVDAAGSAARMDAPFGLTTNGTRSFISDSNSLTIREFNLETLEVRTLAGADGVPGSADGPGLSARFNVLRGAALVGDNLYIVEAGNHTIRRLNLTTEIVTTFAGMSGMFGDADGIGTAAQFSGPEAITSDGTSLFVTEPTFNRIRRIDIETAEVTTFAGNPTPGFLDGIGTAAQFDTILGIATDGVRLYVADANNNRVRQIEIATAEVTTLVGDGTGASTDGVGTAAQTNAPISVAVGARGLYVGEGGGALLRLVE